MKINQKKKLKRKRGGEKNPKCQRQSDSKRHAGYHKVGTTHDMCQDQTRRTCCTVCVWLGRQGVIESHSPGSKDTPLRREGTAQAVGQRGDGLGGSILQAPETNQPSGRRDGEGGGGSLMGSPLIHIGQISKLHLNFHELATTYEYIIFLYWKDVNLCQLLYPVVQQYLCWCRNEGSCRRNLSVINFNKLN